MDRTLIVLLSLSVFLTYVIESSCQDVPPIACPQYFQYLSYDGMFIGKVTLPVSGSGTTILELRFSQRGSTNGQYGRVVTFYDKDVTRENLKNGRGLIYRVDFPFSNVLPKLTRITVNGQMICAASDYPPPSSVIRMQHNLTISETIVQEIQPLATSFGNNVIPPNIITNNNNNPFAFDDGNRPDYTTNVIQSYPPEYYTSPVHRPVQRPPPTTPYPFVPRTTQQPFLPPSPVPTFVQPPASPLETRQDPRPVPSSPQSIQQVCGRRMSTFSPFIHHGTALVRGQFPWLTAINEKVSGGVQFLCSGSLVSARTVITAAHCFKSRLKAENVVLYLGRYNLDDYGETDFILRQVQYLHIHPQYNASRLADADIAVMHLGQPVPFTNFISPICLWSETDDLAQIIGLKGYVAGWGADESGRPISNIPKMVNATIVDGEECKQSVDGFSSLVTSRTICAGNRDGSGPCMGDSGSGLMIERNQRWVLRGVVSAGQTVDGRCMLESYVVYCDLAKHKSWVESNIVY